MGAWRKSVRIVAALAVFSALLVAGALGYMKTSGVPQRAHGKVDRQIELTPQRIAHGRRIVSMLCMDCHVDPRTQVLTGRRMHEVPTSFGKVFSRNITKHPVKGIGAWTDGELAYFLRTSIKPNGRQNSPIMPTLEKLADEDVDSIIAFLRSDHPWVAAADVDDHDSEPAMLVLVLMRTIFAPPAYPAAPVIKPNVAKDPLAYGRYLAQDMLDCYGCHSADFKKMNRKYPEKSAGYFGGGNVLYDVNGRAISTTNLTPDRETGIGAWSDQDFLRAMRDGFRPDGTPIRRPMMRYPELTDDELRAMYTFLKTVPALHHPRKPGYDYQAVQGAPAPGEQTPASRGKVIYYKYACYACHADSGVGVADLTDADKKYPTDAAITEWIRDPSKLAPGTKMPTWQGVIAEDEYAPLVAYVRQLGQARK